MLIMTQAPPANTKKLTEDSVNGQLKLADALVSVDEKPGETVVQAAPFSLRYLREQAEIKAIQSALKLTGWNRKQASRLLKISYRGLLYKIRRHDIHPA
jgi:transcriptional regulator with GAF, ATPase, and Fis domain